MTERTLKETLQAADVDPTGIKDAVDATLRPFLKPRDRASLAAVEKAVTVVSTAPAAVKSAVHETVTSAAQNLVDALRARLKVKRQELDRAEASIEEFAKSLTRQAASLGSTVEDWTVSLRAIQDAVRAGALNIAPVHPQSPKERAAAEGWSVEAVRGVGYVQVTPHGVRSSDTYATEDEAWEHMLNILEGGAA